MRASILAALLALSLPACVDGAPPSPPGKFVCGQTTFCDATSELCVLSAADGGGQAASCTPSATFCSGMPACSCAKSECPGTCSQGDDGSVTVTCSN